MNPGYETRTITDQTDHPTSALIEACGLPEIGSELGDSSVRVGILDQPFSLANSVLTISPDVASDFWDAACTLREALELQAIGGGEPRWAHRIIAHATAAVYGETLLRKHEGSTSSWPLVAPQVGSRLLRRSYDSVAVAEEIAGFLQRRDHLDECPAGEVRAAARALRIADPTEVLLTIGGDHRQSVDWEVGTNTYGLSPRPVPWRTQFGSCTASSPSPRAFAAARQLRHQLVRAAIDDVLDDAVEDSAATIRTAVLRAFGLPSDGSVAVVLTPSGTDAEFVALSLVMPEDGQLLSVVLAPTEIGSGSLQAASGQHFSHQSPFGDTLQPGELLEGVERDSIRIATVDVRDAEGQLLAAGEVEAEMREHISASRGKVLVHCVEGTKTGVRLPSLETLRRWEEEYGERITVVVDAAQVRIDQSTVRTHVLDGRIVFVTGSKFFGGPPFSGAVLVPVNLVRQKTEPPFALSQYLSRHDVPESLPSLRHTGRREPNFGLLVRWAAAIAEITSFLNASPEIRDEILRRLSRGIREIIDESPHLRLVESPFTAFPTPDHRGLDDLPTIFSFLVLDLDGVACDLETTKKIHRLLVADLSDADSPEADLGLRRLARQPYHIGQPVAVSQPGGSQAGALRIAIGAPTLSQIVFDVSRGPDWSDRLELDLAEVQGAIDKIAMILNSVDRA